jgi:hypothetical protein
LVDFTVTEVLNVMRFRLRMLVAEALGAVNRWYCSQAYGRRIDDPDLLLTYFIKSGGAADFAARFDEAMGAVNRWYCSEHYRRDIRAPEVLWNYYSSRGAPGSGVSQPGRLSRAS